jgi:O-antigen ligase
LQAPEASPRAARPRRTPPRSDVRDAIKWALKPVNLTMIAVMFWMTGPIALLIPNLDDALTGIYTLRVGAVQVPTADVDDALLRSLWLPVYAVFLAMAFIERRAVWDFLARNWALVLVLGWTFLSTLWSISPGDTARRGFALGVCTLYGIVLGARYGSLTTIRYFAAAIAIGMVASVLCATAFPGIGLSGGGSYLGSWRGIYANKNSMGASMLKGCLAFWILYSVDGKRWYLAGFGAAVFLLLLSTAKTPIIILLLLAGILAVLHGAARNPQRVGTVLGLGLSALSFLLLVAYTFQAQMLAIMDRDPTFTGRTEIWQLTWDTIQNRFWLGYGYGAFWAVPYGPATQIWDSLSWRVPNSHSGILELWLGIGFIGFALFCVFMIRTCAMIARYAAYAPAGETLWHVGLALIFLTYSFSESASLEHNSIGWVTFTAVVAAVERPAARARRRLRSMRTGPQPAGAAPEPPPLRYRRAVRPAR